MLLDGPCSAIPVVAIPFQEQCGASEDAPWHSRYGDRLRHLRMVRALGHSDLTSTSLQLWPVAEICSPVNVTSLHLLYRDTFSLDLVHMYTRIAIIVREHRPCSTVPLHSFPSTMATLRKRKPWETLRTLSEVDKNPKKWTVDLTKQLGPPPSMVNTAVSKRKKIEVNVHAYGMETKHTHSWKHDQLENALLSWFKQAWASNITLDGRTWEGFRDCRTSWSWHFQCLKWLGLPFQRLPRHRLEMDTVKCHLNERHLSELVVFRRTNCF